MDVIRIQRIAKRIFIHPLEYVKGGFWIAISKIFKKWSDEQYIKLIYWLRFHRKINLENPQTFNEKLNWEKLYYRDPLFTKLSYTKPVDINHGFPRRIPEFNKPEAFEKMKELASKISKGIPFVRVDFFYVKNRIYFGECTFYDWGGDAAHLKTLNGI